LLFNRSNTPNIADFKLKEEKNALYSQQTSFFFEFCPELSYESTFSFRFNNSY